MTFKPSPSLLGSGGGAAVGFMLGGPIGAAIGAATGFLGGRRYQVVNKMTPARKKVYEEALKSLPDPIKLRKLADVFESEGLKEEASLLRKRAMLKELPPEKKAERKLAFRKAMTVGKDIKATPENIAKVKNMAATFRSQGATGNAATLMKHANGLEKLIAKK